MVQVSRGLFDPRQRGVEWPEPNDDPNIPYVWGLNGLGDSSTATKAESTNEVVSPLSSPEAPIDPSYIEPVSDKYAGLFLGTIASLGMYGFVSGFSDSKNKTPVDRLQKGLAKGVLYASIFGIYIDKNS